MILSGAVYLFKTNKVESIVSQSSSSPTTIDQIAAEITVKILATEAIGSGTIWDSQDSNYIVVTNKHVLRVESPPYHIQTSDGQIHHARVLSNSQLDDYDIAVLRFRAVHNSYQTAIPGDFLALNVGESVFAAGFPYDLDNENLDIERSPNELSKLALKTGRVSIVLDKALEEGYQIGYTNDVKKGMSGGPLLNIQGEVVGINGKHAYPLWDQPDLFEDGSQPCFPLQKLITRSSLAIPFKTIIQIAPPSIFLSNYDDDKLRFKKHQQPVVVNSKQNNNIEKLIYHMQAEARFSKSCREFSPDLGL